MTVAARDLCYDSGMTNYPKTRKSSSRKGVGLGIPRTASQRDCHYCTASFVAKSNARYCSRKCYVLAHSEQGDGCWLWTGYVRPGGYGEAYFERDSKRVRVLAHRASYEAFHGAVGELCVCHRCDVRSCVNPAHLFLGTHADNSADRNAKGRQARGERNGPAKLAEWQVQAIRADKRLQREIAVDYGVTDHTISAIQSRKLWRHVA